MKPFLAEDRLDHVSILLADDHEDFLATTVRELAAHFDVVNAVGDGEALLTERQGSNRTWWSSTFPCPC